MDDLLYQVPAHGSGADLKRVHTCLKVCYQIK